MGTLNLMGTHSTKTSLKQRAQPTTPPAPRVAGDELFPETVAITCRVCDRVEHVTLDYPALLCAACLNALGDVTRALADAYAGALQAFLDASTALAERAAGNAWYAKTEIARGDMSVNPETFAKAWAAAKAAGGEKSELVAMRDNVDSLAEHMRAAEQRYIAAAPELAAARAFLGEPVTI